MISKVSILIAICLHSLSGQSQIIYYHELSDYYSEIEDDFSIKDQEYEVTIYEMKPVSESPRPEEKFLAKYSFNDKGRLKEVIRFKTIPKGITRQMHRYLVKESISYDENFHVTSILMHTPKIKFKYSKRGRRKMEKKFKKTSWKGSGFKIFKYDMKNSTMFQYSGKANNRDTIKEEIKFRQNKRTSVRFVKNEESNFTVLTDSFVVNNDTLYHFKALASYPHQNKKVDIDWIPWRVKYKHPNRNKFVMIQMFYSSGIMNKLYNEKGLPYQYNYANGKGITTYDYDSKGLLIKKSEFFYDKPINVLIYEYKKID